MHPRENYVQKIALVRSIVWLRYFLFLIFPHIEYDILLSCTMAKILSFFFFLIQNNLSTKDVLLEEELSDAEPDAWLDSMREKLSTVSSLLLN